MACQIKRKEDGTISEVLAPNGKPSILYRDLVTEMPNIRQDVLQDEYVKQIVDSEYVQDSTDEEVALAAWSKAYTADFIEQFGDWQAAKVSNTDANGEPNLSALFKQDKVKPGVAELFEQNPELANQVYEALGIKNLQFPVGLTTKVNESSINLYTGNLNKRGVDREYFVINANGVKQYKFRIFFHQSDYVAYLSDITKLNRANRDIKAIDIIPLILNEFKNESEEMGVNYELYSDPVISSYGKIFLNELASKNIISKTEFKFETNKSKYDKTKYEYEDKFIYKFNLNYNNQITPQQEQQAQEQYSTYLNQVFPDSVFKNIMYHGGKREDLENITFDTSFFKSGEGFMAYGVGFYFTDNKNTAHSYARTSKGKGKPVVIHAILNGKNPKSSDFKDNWPDDKLKKMSDEVVIKWKQIREERDNLLKEKRSKSSSINIEAIDNINQINDFYDQLMNNRNNDANQRLILKEVYSFVNKNKEVLSPFKRQEFEVISFEEFINSQQRYFNNTFKILYLKEIETYNESIKYKPKKNTGVEKIQAQIEKLTIAEKELFKDFFNKLQFDDDSQYDSIVHVTKGGMAKGGFKHAKGEIHVIAPTPEQIHILGSKQDIEGFKEFVKNKKQVTIKQGISELFLENPQIATIGTQEQYSQYLDQVFPDSKVKDIVYHGTNKRLEFFSKDFIGKNENVLGVNGFNLAVEKENAENYARDKNFKKIPEGLHSVIVNVNNPVLVESGEKPFEKLFKLDKEAFDNDYNNAKKLSSSEVTLQLKSKGFDSVYNKMRDWQSSYIVFEPEQIHILGSKQDIAGFKQFVSNPLPTSTKWTEIKNNCSKLL